MILPIVALVILIFVFSLVNKHDPLPVAVKVVVSLFCPPYSVGLRNCLSLVELWLDVETIMLSYSFVSIKVLPKIKPSHRVAQAE